MQGRTQKSSASASPSLAASIRSMATHLPDTCESAMGPTADQRYKSLKELMADGSRDRAAAQAAAARALRCFMTSWAPTGFDAPLFRMWSGIHLRRYRVGRWLLKRRVTSSASRIAVDDPPGMVGEHRRVSRGRRRTSATPSPVRTAWTTAGSPHPCRSS